MQRLLFPLLVAANKLMAAVYLEQGHGVLKCEHTTEAPSHVLVHHEGRRSQFIEECGCMSGQAMETNLRPPWPRHFCEHTTWSQELCITIGWPCFTNQNELNQMKWMSGWIDRKEWNAPLHEWVNETQIEWNLIQQVHAHACGRMNGMTGCNNIEWYDVQNLNEQQWAVMNMSGGIHEECKVLDRHLHVTKHTVMEVDWHDIGWAVQRRCTNMSTPNTKKTHMILSPRLLRYHKGLRGRALTSNSMKWWTCNSTCK